MSKNLPNVAPNHKFIDSKIWAHAMTENFKKTAHFLSDTMIKQLNTKRQKTLKVARGLKSNKKTQSTITVEMTADFLSETMGGLNRGTVSLKWWKNKPI